MGKKVSVSTILWCLYLNSLIYTQIFMDTFLDFLSEIYCYACDRNENVMK